MSEQQQATRKTMRIWHRYLGFFLTGIMAMYALSGIVMVFRTTDFLKKEYQEEKVIDQGLEGEALGKALKIKGFKSERTEGDVIYFKTGTYNQATGKAQYTVKKLPFLLDKMTRMHKATVNSPLYILNIFFGVALLFFVVTSFWMFKPSTNIFRKGLYWTIGGIVLTLIMLFV